jgi:hypothetical protein
MIMWHGTNKWNSIKMSRFLGVTQKDYTIYLQRKYQDEETKKMLEKHLQKLLDNPEKGKKVTTFFTHDIIQASTYGDVVLGVNFPEIKRATRATRNFVYHRKIDVLKLNHVLFNWGVPEKHIDKRKTRQLCERCKKMVPNYSINTFDLCDDCSDVLY